jgi:hypothetical protein
VTRILLALVLLAGCPPTDNPARQAIDAQARSAEAPASPTPAPAEETWSCPMHPEVVQHHAGKCPKCGMDLVKKGG